VRLYTERAERAHLESALAALGDRLRETIATARDDSRAPTDAPVLTDVDVETVRAMLRGESDPEEDDAPLMVRAPGAQSDEAAETVFRVERLLELGIEAPEATRIQERYDAARLRFLEAWRDGARDGAPRQRATEAAAAARDALRGELGDEGYDSMLYAAGRPNRLRIREVLRGSETEQGGIRGPATCSTATKAAASSGTTTSGGSSSSHSPPQRRV
jgi:hypothetical protein